MITYADLVFMALNSENNEGSNNERFFMLDRTINA